MGKVKNGVPDRWYDYKSLGTVIEGTRIIAFKVPLQYAQIDIATEEDYRLNVDKLIKELPNLGVVIDLTNTSRYYNPTELEKNGVIHAKIFVPGHVIPRKDLRNSFRSYVKSFLEENKDNDKIIGVHCTHGVNRTGFMICDYLVHELKMHPLEAIKVFEAARNHRIERANYRDFLIEGKEEDSQQQDGGQEFSRKRKSYETNEGSVEKRQRFAPDYSQSNSVRGNWRQDPPRRHEDPRNKFSGLDRWRQDRPSGRHEPSGSSGRWGDNNYGERRQGGYQNQKRRNPFVRSRSPSPEIGAPRIPRTPPPSDVNQFAPRSRHSQPQDNRFYRSVIPQHRKLSRHLTQPIPEFKEFKGGNPFK